ncbi:putative methionyl-tRNA synthetase [Hordeum vulgare]|nr:putative methionyl-tRNA synthetase [Hordeum vulgare]
MELITGAYQNTETYWRRIKTTFDERKLVEPEFVGIHMERGDQPLDEHPTRVQQVAWDPEEMVQMFEMFRRGSNTDADFKFLHVFTRIESCVKWGEVQLALAKAKDGVYNPDAPVSKAAEGRPHGNKKAVKVRDSVPAFKRLHASIEQCITNAESHSAMREEKSEARWPTLMTKQDAKLDFSGPTWPRRSATPTWHS